MTCECGAEIIRRPGAGGPLPKRCYDCRPPRRPYGTRAAACTSCGKAVWRNPKLSREDITCNTCAVRRQGDLPAHRVIIWLRICPECSSNYLPIRENQVVCGQKCRKLREGQWNARKAREDPDFRAMRLTMNANRRAKTRYGLPPILQPRNVLKALIERDLGVCQLCQQPVKDATGPMGPSIDHIIPLSLGGEHAIHNCQLAHLACNTAKGNRIAAGQEPASRWPSEPLCAK
jgi:5-methylcytosine-specific restriction endonuclease McrA